MRKYIIPVLFISIVFVSGCTNINNKDIKTNLIDNNTIKIDENNKEFISSIDDRFTYSTTNWNAFDPIRSDRIFSIRYPKNWTLGTSVFDDENGNKVAEFMPGLVILKPNQACFDSEEKSSMGDETVSKEKIKIGNLNGVLKIENDIEGNRNNYYCLSNEKNAFVIKFIGELSDSNKKLFEQILSTLVF